MTGHDVRLEQEHDHAAVREVHARAFGHPDRVPGLVDDLRTARAPLPPLSLVATVDDSEGDRVVGHVMLSGCRLDASERLVAVYALSPLGVLPEFQRSGIGTALIGHALSAADAQGIPLVFLEGAPGYYGARGFDDAERLGFRPPTLRYPPGAYQVARLSAYEDWMHGTLVYSDVFWAHDCVGLRGERLRALQRAGGR
ncbi:N-acetyltransferase [Micromonospora sp. NBC_00898]|uniref:GNAT family N-acetyltransferase n=1 Tax=Micromonospora sp. NBC_00898 TaxID=2975981 RepID=UPI00386B4666|nr:N-acetyltransferase [Micromonospora sp. NBC_00898]